jgi:ribonuclease Z
MLNLAGTLIDALSVGGLETCIQIPKWKLAFDIGRCPRKAVFRETILFTHAHMDHMGGVAFHAATRGLMHLAPPTYVVGPENAEALAGFLEAARRLDRSDLACTIVPVGPGGEYALTQNLIATPFRAVHVVPTQGYGIWERRNKLKAAYRDLPGETLRDLRQAGEPITEQVDVPLLAFTGDTRIELVEREEVVRTAKVLVMECTFVDERVSVEKARESGHVHLFELAEKASLFENEAILLTHFSARYKAAEIEAALDKHLPPALRERVTALVSEH